MFGRRHSQQVVTGLVLVTLALVSCTPPLAPEATDPLTADAPANQPPVVAISGPASVVLGEAVAITVTAEDPDGDELTFEWSMEEQPESSEVGAEDLHVNGAIAAFTPDALGTFSVRVTVSDGAASVAATHTLTVVLDAPTSPGGPHPPDGATDVLYETMLTWSAENADTYDVFVRFGRMEDFALLAGNLSMPGLAATLEPGQTYEWYVVARNAQESTTGPIWQFSTQPVSLWTGLAAHWAFEGSFDDWSGWEHHLLRYNPRADAPVQLTTDRFGRQAAAIDTQGAGDALYTVPEKGSPLTSFQDGFAVSFWLRDMGGNEGAGLLWHGADESQGYEIAFDSKSGIELVRHTATVLTIGSDSLTGVWYAPEWNHVVISWDFASRRVEAWVNNKVVAASDVDRFTDTAGGLLIGVNQRDWLNARLDEMRIYTRPLNAAEVLALFAERPDE